jgi:hypothetical protein
VAECVSSFWILVSAFYETILDLDGVYAPLYRPVPSRHGIPGMQHLHFCFRLGSWSFPGCDEDECMLHMARAIDVIGAHWHRNHVPECDLIVTFPLFQPYSVAQVEEREDEIKHVWADAVVWTAQLGCVHPWVSRDRLV